MARIDEMIEAARNAAKNAEGEEKARQQARAEALLEMKGEGYTKTDTEVGGIVKRNREEAGADSEKWTEIFGMTMEEVEEAVAELENATDDLSEGDDDDAEPSSVLERMRSALSQRDSRIEDLSTSHADLNRRYAKDKVDVAFANASRDAGLDDKFLAPARELAAYGDLVEKITKGETVSPDEITERVNSVKEISDVWFKSDERQADRDHIIAGHRIKEEAIRPHIPATPTAKESAEITDADRAARATSVY